MLKNVKLSENFPAKVQDELQLLLSNTGVIPNETVHRWLEMGDIEIGDLMIQLLPAAASFARVSISNYYVGAVALGMPPKPPILGPGSLYLGSNMEFTDQALSFCVHAEQSATNNAWLHGEEGLQALAINAAPCGYCRQFLYEITTANKGFNILLKKNDVSKDYSYTSTPLTYYLPDPFGPGDLGMNGGLMESENHELTISSTDPLAQATLSGANACYSPYTKDYCAVGLKRSNSEIFIGRYAENAAYNPSMSPLESALAYMNMNIPCQEAFDISEAILVESPSLISQKDATIAVLSSISPGIQLNYIQAIENNGL